MSIPVIAGDPGYLEALENVFRASNLCWFFEYLEDRFISMGYLGNYDIQTALFLWKRGFRVKTSFQTGEEYLDTTLVRSQDWNYINKLKRDMFIVNPYVKRLKRY